MKIKENEIYFGDSIDILKNLPDNYFDAFICDPPYGINYDQTNSQARKQERVIKEYIDVPADQYEDFSQSWIKEAYRTTRNGGSIYIMSGYTNFEYILKALRISGFNLKMILAWQYNFPGYAKYNYIGAHTSIAYAVKSKDWTFDECARFDKEELDANGYKAYCSDRISVWYKSKERWDNHWTTKTRTPEDIIKKMIQYSTNVNDLICDPFSGSGQVPITCKLLGRRFIAFEKAKEAYNFARHRLKTNRYLIPANEEIPDYTKSAA